jgi:hypothetical protein
MKRAQIVREAMIDASSGSCHVLFGMIDHLLVDCEISVDRIMAIAWRRFGIPYAVTLATIQQYV